jgi:hypothetical protein
MIEDDAGKITIRKSGDAGLIEMIGMVEFARAVLQNEVVTTWAGEAKPSEPLTDPMDME